MSSKYAGELCNSSEGWTPFSRCCSKVSDVVGVSAQMLLRSCVQTAPSAMWGSGCCGCRRTFRQPQKTNVSYPPLLLPTLHPVRLYLEDLWYFLCAVRSTSVKYGPPSA